MSATTPVEQAALSAPQSNYVLPGNMAWAVYELAYRAKAALELLHTSNQVDGSDALTGVSYLLQKLAHDTDAAAAVISNGERGLA